MSDWLDDMVKERRQKQAFALKQRRLTLAQKLFIPILWLLAGEFLSNTGATSSNEILLLLGMAFTQFSAFLLSLAVIPHVKPKWSILVGSFSGLIFSLAALFLGVRALWLSTQTDLFLVRMSGYVFLAISALSIILLIRLSVSPKPRFGWYQEIIVGLLKAGEHEWCIVAAEEALALLTTIKKSGKIESFLIEKVNDAEAALHNQIGFCYFRKGQHRPAIQEFSKAIALQPAGKVVRGGPGNKLAIAYTNRADVHIALGEYEAAISDCEEALKIDPNDGDAQELLERAKRRLQEE